MHVHSYVVFRIISEQSMPGVLGENQLVRFSKNNKQDEKLREVVTSSWAVAGKLNIFTCQFKGEHFNAPLLPAQLHPKRGSPAQVSLMIEFNMTAAAAGGLHGHSHYWGLEYFISGHATATQRAGVKAEKMAGRINWMKQDTCCSSEVTRDPFKHLDLIITKSWCQLQSPSHTGLLRWAYVAGGPSNKTNNKQSFYTHDTPFPAESADRWHHCFLTWKHLQFEFNIPPQCQRLPPFRSVWDRVDGNVLFCVWSLINPVQAFAGRSSGMPRFAHKHAERQIPLWNAAAPPAVLLWNWISNTLPIKAP